VLAGATARAADGLALSSRNGYLSADERAEAPALAQTLRALATAVQAGATDAAALETQALDALRTRGWAPDYVALRRQADLALPDAEQPLHTQPLVVLAAARLGRTRLIDNLELPASATP
jgi:pantoate--beta-alanine ligase